MSTTMSDSTIMHDTPSTDSEGEHACAIVWDAETVRDMHEMIERTTGHPCAGSVGGSCPVLPRALSSVAKQHADPRAVKAHAVKVIAEHAELEQERQRRAARSTCLLYTSPSPRD